MTATPEMIAAAWGAWQSRHGGKLGPGPAFVEAINAALSAANPERSITMAPQEAEQGRTVSREEAISFLEGACRNWSYVPKLSEDEIGDVATELLRFVNKKAGAR